MLVMMLDEIDKLGAGVQGDPGAALLEVSDPEQNATSRDNYLAMPFDLAASSSSPRPMCSDTVRPLSRPDRDVVDIAGYTANEKFEIPKRYLVPRQMEENGLKIGQVELSDDAVRNIIDHYTREAGVRSLERQIGKVLRHAAVRVSPKALPVPFKSGRDYRRTARRGAVRG